MVMKLLLCSFLAAAIALSVAVPNVNVDLELHITNLLASTPTLTFLGRVNDKRFFHVNQTKTWFDQKNYCTEIGMDLVSIETREEHEFLATAEYPIRWLDFWTSARDSGSRSQYRWSGGNGGALPDFATFWNDSPTNFTCIYISVPSGSWREWGCNYGETAVCQLVTP